MKQWTRGFTLIEVLIVVLIVAILSAIAVPQYQKAVLKSRFSSLVPLGKTLNESNEAYYMEHGNYSDSLGDLDVTTNDNNVQVTMGNEDQHQYVLLTRDDIKNNLRMYQKHSPNFAGETHCEALQDNAQANWLCRDSLKGTLVGNKYGYTVYSLGEKTVGTLARAYINQKNIQLEGQDSCTGTVEGGCDKVQAKNGSICDGKAYNSCTLGIFDNGSVCKGTGYMACKGNKYTNGSSCIGDSYWNPCSNYSTFTTNSFCVGKSRVACNGSTFTDHSYCEGEVNSCQNAHFRENSICYAYKTEACLGSDYDQTSYCTGGTNGSFCPNGAPSPTAGKIWYRGTGDEWPNSRVSELIDAPTTTD